MKTKALTLLFCIPLGAQVIDQGFNNAVTGGNSIDRQFQLQQTFTVGVEGLLSEVRLDLFKNTVNTHQDLYMAITRPGDPNYYALEYVDPDNIAVGMENSTMLSVPISNPVGLEVGEVWTIHLFSHRVGDYSINWTRDPAAPYAGGQAFSYSGDTGLSTPIGVDQSFFTVMDPQDVTGDPPALGVVPEPATYAAVFAAGLMGFAGWRRMRCSR